MIVWGIVAWLGWGTKEFFFFFCLVEVFYILILGCLHDVYICPNSLKYGDILMYVQLYFTNLILKNEGRIIAFHLRPKRRDLFVSDTHHKNCWKQFLERRAMAPDGNLYLNERAKNIRQYFLKMSICLSCSFHLPSIHWTIYLFFFLHTHLILFHSLKSYFWFCVSLLGHLLHLSVTGSLYIW